MNSDRNKKIILGTGVAIFIFIAIGAAIFTNADLVFAPTEIVVNTEEIVKIVSSFVLQDESNFSKKLVSPPSPVKGIYVTSWVAGTESRLKNIINLVNTTELNAVVIDVKDYSGYLSFRTNIPFAEEIGAHGEPRIRDINELIERLHKDNIYVIGRVQVFQDPILAIARPDLAVADERTGEVWKDDKGLSWVDPASKEAWDYNIAIAQELNKRGFDEVNLDYIRFPSDGNLEVMKFPFWNETTPRYEIIGSFFKYFREKTKKDNIVISADIFGMASWQAYNTDYDLGIGQRLRDAILYFDYVSPMVYPSHYANLGTGFENPAEHPYEIVNMSLVNAQKLIATTSSSALLRPWLQDFDLGANYDADKVRAQIMATNDNNIGGWLLWNASNYYTKEALKTE